MNNNHMYARLSTVEHRRPSRALSDGQNIAQELETVTITPTPSSKTSIANEFMEKAVVDPSRLTLTTLHTASIVLAIFNVLFFIYFIFIAKSMNNSHNLTFIRDTDVLRKQRWFTVHTSGFRRVHSCKLFNNKLFSCRISTSQVISLFLF